MITLDRDIESMKRDLARQSERLAKYRSTVPEGECGPWSVCKVEIKFGIELLRMVRDGRGCPPGTYTQLRHDSRGVVMSDTDAEIHDFLDFVTAARGTVIVAGLGLGVVTQALLAKPSVKHVTVVEIDGDVIELVHPHIASDRLTVVKADVRKNKPCGRYDFGWLDIWDSICGDDAKDMRALKRKYQKFCKHVAAWCESERENAA